MSYLITFLVAFISGFIGNIFLMRISFKNKTIDLKISTYNNIISCWVEMRNFIVNLSYENIKPNPSECKKFDKIYAASLKYIGQAFLFTEDKKLAEDIRDFNEKFCREEAWIKSRNERDDKLKKFYEEGISIINKMSSDVKDSTRFTCDDFKFLKLCPK